MNEKTLQALEFHTIKDMLVDLTQSSLGEKIVNELQPVKDFYETQQRLQETTQAVQALVKRGNPPLSGIHDISSSLEKIQIDAILSPSELLRISDIFKTVRMLKKYSSEVRENQRLEIIDDLIDKLIYNKEIEQEIDSKIVNEEEIDDNASTTLKNIRRQILNTNNNIRDKLNQIITSNKYQKYLQDNIVTVRDERYVIPVKQEYKSELKGLVHDSSASGATLFIEPLSVVELNNKLKQLKIEEKKEIENILTQLTNLINENIDTLKNNLSVLGKIDFIFAKGKLSLKLEAIEPKINNVGYLSLIQARHPLLDHEKVVPIDVELGNGFNVLVITGPNTGGKTVALKTVGLFVAMTQSGLHIPVKDGSEISIFTQIFADIGDEQSIEQSLSTFSSHMTNIVNILEQADSTSLCLFDEIGAGTDPTEGSALAMSMMNYLNEINSKAIVTTHYSELKIFALSNEGFENASCEFDIETLEPTYKILMGVPGKSNAFEISSRLGLSNKIIEQAKEYVSKEGVEFEDIINNLHKEKEAVKEEKQKAESYRKEVEKLKQELEKQKSELQNEKQNIILNAKQEALEISQQAEEEADKIVDEMKKLIKEKQQQKREKTLTEKKQELKTNVNKYEREISKFSIDRTDKDTPPKDVNPGQEIYIVSIGQDGVVLSYPDDNGDLQVQVGMMKINVNIEDLRVKKKNKKDKKIKTSNSFTVRKTADIAPEISVRQQYLDDAIINIDKYLDDAYLSGLSEITIIHGKGKGILREGIHKFLRKHPHVKSFRSGRYGEGEQGVTIVELK